MASPKRMMPHGSHGSSTWHATLAQTRWTRTLLAKIALVVCSVALVMWNLSMLSMVGNGERTPRGQQLAPPFQANKLRTREQEDAEEATPQAAVAGVLAIQTPSSSETEAAPLAWFLDPEWYKLDTGCDFSATVALFDPSQLDINCGNIHRLKYGEFLGQGFWRDVYKANWEGRNVAVKVVKDKLLDRHDIIPRHVEEAAAMFPIRNEPNIVSLVGWCNSTVVVEFVPHKLDELVFDKSKELPVLRALMLARDAARGLMQLHEAPGGPFAHTDIQTRQFLVEWTGKLKLNDFNRVKYTGKCLLPQAKGMTKCLSSVAVAKGKWRAPEEYRKDDIDEKVDIYSLSLVLWSLRAREKPFRDLEREQVYKQVPQGLRPPVDAMADFPQEMQQLILRGWHDDKFKRPSAREYAKQIDHILKKYVATHSER